MDNAMDFLFSRSSTGSMTQPLTPENAKMLRSAVSISRHEESGWYCATGFDKDNRVIVRVHAKSRMELDLAIDPDRYRQAYTTTVLWDELPAPGG